MISSYFVYFFDVTDGNPNGDPDAGNMPRIDPETNQGLVTDVCLKRKVRNYVAATQNGRERYDIYIRERAVLNQEHEKAYKKHDLPPSNKLPKDDEKARKLTEWMCDNFFDIRTFGAVMTTEINCGQVRGPVQLTFARSIDPIVTGEFSITRCAVTNARDLEKERTMGRKFTVPYALYRCHGFFNPTLAEKTLFEAEDFELLKRALNEMFEVDHSAARGQMAPVRCIAFRHENKLGNARADELFSLITVEKQSELLAENRPARSSRDYAICISDDLPQGITVEEWVNVRSTAAKA